MDKFFSVPFALSGDQATVPDAAVGSGEVSYMEGYGPDYQLPASNPDSKNIERQKMNNIFYAITKSIGELQSQGVPDFIDSALNGGSPYPYSAFALVRYAGLLYVSLVNANTSLPTDDTKWGVFDPNLKTILASDSGTNNIGYKRAATATEHRTQTSVNDDAVSVFNWFTPAEIADVVSRSRSVNVLSSLRKAVANAKSLIFPAGDYWCGSVSSSTFGGKLLDWTGRGDDISMQNLGNVTFVAEVSAGVVDMIYFSGNSNLDLGEFTFTDPTYTPSAPVTGLGLRGCTLENSGAQNFGNFSARKLTGRKIKEPLAVGSFLPRTGAIRGIRAKIVAETCYYGYNANNDGNDAHVDITAKDCFRPFFAYGCRDVHATVNNSQQRSSTAAVNISRGVSGPATENIEVDYFSRDCTQDITHVLINHIDMLGGTIDGVVVRLDIKQSVPYDPLRIVTYTAAGGVETATPTNNIVDNVRGYGRCDAQARAVTTTATYNIHGLLEFEPSRYFQPSSALLQQFMLGTETVTTPSWTSISSPQPVLGNGFLQGWHRLLDQGEAAYRMLLQFGSTTTAGTGEWNFTAPFTASRIVTGSVVLRDASGNALYTGQCRMAQGSNIITFALGVTPALTTGPTPTQPFTWAVSDRLEVFALIPVGYQTP